MHLEICKLDSENETVTVLPEGNHVIGRGGTLQCNDKRISRMHATIDVKNEEASITSIHINPCYHMAANSKTVTILPQQQVISLEDGDKFGLLPDLCWFKVKFVPNEKEEGTDNGTTSIDSSCKRMCEDVAVECSHEKRIKVDEISTHKNELPTITAAVKEDIHINKSKEDKQGEKINNGILQENISETTKTVYSDPEATVVKSENNILELTGQVKEEIEDNYFQIDEVKMEIGSPKIDCPNEMNGIQDAEVLEQNSEITTEQISQVPPEPDQATSGPNQVTLVPDQVTPEPDQATPEPDQATPVPDQATATGSTSRPRRERCWYGATCYRKNPNHRNDFTHPGDSDYASDPEDDRPSCSFGATCYRKNKDHRKNYKHPPRQRPSDGRRKKRNAAMANVPNYAPLDDDDDDTPDDLFGEDSDEYDANSDSESDSDFEDSQNAEEDSQEIRRMLREANRFTRTKK